MKHNKLLFEVCANSIQSALNAEAARADRIELCEQLEIGGVTPRHEVIIEEKEKISIPIHVLVRPRGGDFCYSEKEFRIMKKDIEWLKQVNVAGVVIGILNPDFTIDKIRCAELINLARPLSVTFHRAFDEVKEPFQTLEELISLGVNRILTSGQKENALDGVILLNQLAKQANDRITILAGGGITEENISAIVQQSGTNEFHFSAKAKLEDGTYVSDLNRIRKISELARRSFQQIYE